VGEVRRRHDVVDLDIYLTTVREYEELVRQIFPMLRLGEVLSGSPA
jgi:hypothetical protein